MKKTIKETTIAKAIIIVGLLICTSIVSFGQTKEKLSGSWVNEPGTRKAEMFQQNDKYFSKITWVSDSHDKLKAGDIIFKELIWTREKL